MSEKTEKSVEAKPAEKVKVRAKEDTYIDGKLLAKDQEGLVTPQQFAALAARLVKVATCIALLLLAGLTAAHGQGVYTIDTVSVTNNVAASTTNTTSNPVVTLTKFEDVGLYFAAQGTHADEVDTLTFQFRASVDGSNYETQDPGNLLFTLTANGTNTVSIVTNLTVGAVGYLKLVSIGNTWTNAATNIVIKAVKKPKRFGS